MGKKPSNAMTFEKTAKNINLRKSSIVHSITDFDKLPTAEIMKRLYRRHSTGLWQAMTIITALTCLYSTLN